MASTKGLERGCIVGRRRCEVGVEVRDVACELSRDVGVGLAPFWVGCASCVVREWGVVRFPADQQFHSSAVLMARISSWVSFCAAR